MSASTDTRDRRAEARSIRRSLELALFELDRAPAPELAAALGSLRVSHRFTFQPVAAGRAQATPQEEIVQAVANAIRVLVSTLDVDLLREALLSMLLAQRADANPFDDLMELLRPLTLDVANLWRNVHSLLVESFEKPVGQLVVDEPQAGVWVGVLRMSADAIAIRARFVGYAPDFHDAAGWARAADAVIIRREDLPS